MRPIHRPHLRDQSVTRLVPNILTLMALCAGLSGIRFALATEWQSAVVAIMVAAVLDGLDGRIARLLHGTSRFGAELDSLSDFVSFGVAPALILYQWTMHEARGIGWSLALVYAVCCALRLARFNTRVDNADLPAWRSRFFVGVPAPAAAALVLMPMYANFEFGPGLANSPIVVGLVMCAVAVLMVSRLPTFSITKVRVPHRHVMPMLLGLAALAAFLIGVPWLTLMTLGVVYLVSLPLGRRAYLRLEQQGKPMPTRDVAEPGDLSVN